MDQMPGRAMTQIATERGVVHASGIPVHCAHDEIVEADALVPNPRNPNRHSGEQIRLLAKIIKRQGWRAPITVSNRSGFIVRGHGRLSAAKLLGVDLVPVDRQDYATEAEEWADLIADNRLSELNEMDGASLTDLLRELDSGMLAALVAECAQRRAAQMGDRDEFDTELWWRKRTCHRSPLRFGRDRRESGFRGWGRMLRKRALVQTFLAVRRRFDSRLADRMRAPA